MMISSDLPDSDDIQSQVLLLGITRYENTSTSSQSKPQQRLPAQQSKSTCDNDRIASVDVTTPINSLVVVYQSNEHLHKSGCFPLERHKPKKTPKSSETAEQPQHSQQQQQQLTNGIQLNRFFDRFQAKKPPSNGNLNRNQVESKSFYRWLHSKRTKHRQTQYGEPSNEPTDSTDQRHLPQHRHTKRKCLTKSGSFKSHPTKTKLTKKSTDSKSGKSRRFGSSCLPYCALSVRNDSIASNSLASSQLGYDKLHKQSGLVASNEPQSQIEQPQQQQKQQQQQEQQQHQLPASDECLMHPSHCTVNNNCAYTRNQSNQNTDNDTNRNNNCSLFNNLNKMDRSVDSIGSCSLDVDAESTDFSGIPIRNIKTTTTTTTTTNHRQLQRTK